MNAKESYHKVFDLLEKHHNWFKSSIPLIASENIPSPAVREAIVSDFGNRYAEGWPGERVYAGCIYIDEVEIICNELAKKVFKSEFADCRATSGVVANLAIYSAFSNPGDYMLAASIPTGGHISHGKKEHSGTAGLVHGLNIEHYPFSKEDMTIDVDATKKKVSEMISNGKKPAIAMFGGSLFLFPHPVKELASFMHDNSIYINYDGAHVAGLIAGGQFQDPIGEGTDSMTMSSHKTLWGPQGGIIVSLERHADSIKKAIFPGNTSSHHLHHVAGKAIALAESLEFGKEYAKQVISNAKILAESLANFGFRVLGEKRGYTESHQLAVDVSNFGDGGTIEKELEKANIILNRQLLPGDIKSGKHYMHPSGVRIGVPEVTRLGMKESEMKEIASFIKQIVIDKSDPNKVGSAVSKFREQFQKVHYAFENATDAYEYIKIRT
ncbi:MAG: serine hydroxymethyltransferase [Nitrososphaeraceae archaeon]|jgi:glycine hydroxymethyltransferase|nr:serine hydroxymethyltransferase [Nitrososphaeraceae archaeon]MDW0168060.1 serine hydroxymethyltransferase [Nitrososphaeraceae archaeon]MDW0171382.1 serine hydroxymethyltransferase [Nitrososphaeraceae archaeon]MDW0173930.1 serine hydroxymethyltransferase [Nitrososphaeraceae archaeon]MDW0175528.1 serine hydroxymethyltransferase [Nitrososphaeraceae archaeon]